MTKSFGEQLRDFHGKAVKTTKTVFVNSSSAALESVKNGSPLTGSPGQPVDTGFLKNSFQLEFPSENVAVISTGVSYARVIEDNTKAEFDPRGVDRPEGFGSGDQGGGTRRIASTVGGHHSVAQTVNNFDRILEQEVAKAKDAA